MRSATVFHVHCGTVRSEVEDKNDYNSNGEVTVSLFKANISKP
jgi:hypothetical protein